MENFNTLTTSLSYLGKKFLNNKGEEIHPENSIFRVKFIGLFFTGSWCPPCEIFAQELIQIYNEANSKEKNFEIIQISNEKNEKEFHENIKDKPWLFVPYNDPVIMNLVNEYKISYLPVLLIINKEKTILTESGRRDVTQYKNKAYDEWYRMYREQREREKDRQEKLLNI